MMIRDRIGVLGHGLALAGLCGLWALSGPACSDDDSSGGADAAVEDDATNDAHVLHDGGTDGLVDGGDGDAQPMDCGTEPICEAATGHHCYYVATDGSDDAAGTIDAPFATIQHGIDTMEPGDYLYLRGGTYHEHSISLYNKRGSEDAWFTVKSYPCEWAIVDAAHEDGDNGINVFVSTSPHGYAPIYWRFEHFEVTGAGPAYDGRTYDDIQSIRGAGFFFWPGYHMQFRYMYIHDNYGGGGPNGGAGIKFQNEGGTAVHHVEITHCHVSDNGWPGAENHNLGNIIFFSDYQPRPEDVDIDVCQHSNVIAYNLIENSNTGFKTKNDQQLVRDLTGDDMEAKDRGNDIHHNIFRHHNGIAIWSAQDFSQVHHNVVDDAVSGILSGKPPSNGSRESFYVVVYNNLVVNSGQGGSISIYHGGEDTEKNYQTEPWHPFWYVFNNIIEAGSDGNGHNDINVLFSWAEHQVDMSTVHIDHDFFYPRSPDDPVIDVADDANDFSVNQYEAQGWADDLFAHEEDGNDPLHPADNPYKLRFDHRVEGDLTIGTAGLDADHPYLPGKRIPAYLGPCEDEACSWIDEVEGLADRANLMEKSRP